MWQATGGATRLRAMKLGRSLRIPRIALLEFLGIAPPQAWGGGVADTGGGRGAA